MTNTRIFTFGFSHTHPFTGESLANCFVRVPGDHITAREKMLQRFGIDWAFEYTDDGIVRWHNMREIVWIDTIYKDSDNAGS